MMGFSLAPEKVLYVSADGDDGDDGSTWALAKATVPAAVAIATGGEVIAIGKGTFTGWIDGRAKSGLQYLGTGPETLLTEAATSETLSLGNNASVRNLAVSNTRVGATQTAIRCDGKDNILLQNLLATAENRPVIIQNCQNARIIDCALFGGECSVHVDNSDSIDTVRIRNCLLHATGWAGCACYAASLYGHTTLTDCVLICESSAGAEYYAAGIQAGAGRIEVYNSHIFADGGVDAGARGAMAVADCESLTLINSAIFTSADQGTPHDLFRLAGLLVVGNTVYDPTKVSGPIILVPPLHNIVTKGPGGTIFTHTVNDGAGQPVAGVEVWITTDRAGTKVIAGPLTTDGDGEAVFVLKPGDYYLWKLLAGWNFDNPESITVG